jgi:hypothetical protein
VQTGERTGERLVGLALAGAIALNYPLLHLFGEGFFLGIPSLYFYLFFVWAALIGLMGLVMRTRPSSARAEKTAADPERSGGA